MGNKKIHLIADSSLNPQNAITKGYRHITDIKDPYKSIQELINLAEKAGYVFGIAKEKNGKIGLFKKLV